MALQMFGDRLCCNGIRPQAQSGWLLDMSAEDSSMMARDSMRHDTYSPITDSFQQIGFKICLGFFQALIRGIALAKALDARDKHLERTTVDGSPQTRQTRVPDQRARHCSKRRVPGAALERRMEHVPNSDDILHYWPRPHSSPPECGEETGDSRKALLAVRGYGTEYRDGRISAAASGGMMRRHRGDANWQSEGTVQSREMAVYRRQQEAG